MRYYQDSAAQSSAVISTESGSGKYKFQVEDEGTPLVGNHASPGSPDWKYSRFRFLYLISRHGKAIKVGVLFVVMFLGIIAFASTEEQVVSNNFALSASSPIDYPLKEEYPKAFLQLEASQVTARAGAGVDLFINLTLQLLEQGNWTDIQQASIDIEVEVGQMSILGSSAPVEKTEKIIWELPSGGDFRIHISTDCETPVALPLKIMQHSSAFRYRELLGALVLGGMYICIIFELIDRTVAAIVGSFIAIACLALVNARPPLSEVVTWIDYGTLALLFGMMMIVGIFSTTGFF